MFIDKSMTKNVISVGPDTPVSEARELLAKHKIRHLPVVDEEMKVIGIITDRDIRTALPSPFLAEDETRRGIERFERLLAKDVMTRNPVTITPFNTLEDAILLMQKMRVGAFPVVDHEGKLKGILSIRDLMRAFINVLGIEEPGCLFCIVVEDKVGQMKRIVDCITEEHISFGSILVARHWEEGKRAVFPYLLTSNAALVKRKLKSAGFELLDPLEWTLDQNPTSDE
ncbi:MAG: CBS domain-containing protein [Deltaproteobacteria bacterium]|nr:CBS domain-containing protein [Deltaproteobacteria bacterium]